MKQGYDEHYVHMTLLGMNLFQISYYPKPYSTFKVESWNLKGGLMSFLAHGAKSLKYNNGQLRKKSFFKELGESKATRLSSKLDLSTLHQKSKIIYQRKYRRSLLTRTLILPFVIISFFLLFWMIYSNFSF